MATKIDPKMFHPILTLQDRALWLASLHERAADYITQAPVLVAASMAYNSASLREVWTELCNRGEKLGSILDTFKVNRGLRNASPKAFRVSHAHRLLMLDGVSPLLLSQQIAARTPEQQTTYIEEIQPISEWATGQHKPVFNWLMEYIPIDHPDLTHVRDFFRSEFGFARFKPDWKWRDVLTGVKHWEAEFAKMKAKEEAKYNIPLTPHSQAPQTFTIKDHTFVMLNTENALRVEGATMHHCVAGYHGAVKSGRSLIYAVSCGDKRKGTLELHPMSYTHQLKVWAEVLSEKDKNLRAPIIITDEDDKSKHPKVEKWKDEFRSETRYRWSQAQFKTYHNGAPDGPAQSAAREFMTEGFLYPDEIKAREKAKEQAEKKIRKAG